MVDPALAHAAAPAALAGLPPEALAAPAAAAVLACAAVRFAWPVAFGLLWQAASMAVVGPSRGGGARGEDGRGRLTRVVGPGDGVTVHLRGVTPGLAADLALTGLCVAFVLGAWGVAALDALRALLPFGGALLLLWTALRKAADPGFPLVEVVAWRTGGYLSVLAALAAAADIAR